MTALRLKVVKVPNDELAYMNCCVVGPATFPNAVHLEVVTGPARHFIFTVKTDKSLAPDQIAFALPQRKWATLSLADQVEARPVKIDHCIVGVVFSVDYNKKGDTAEPLDSDAMARELSMQFQGRAFTHGENLVFKFPDGKGKTHILALIVKSMEGVHGISDRKPEPIQLGRLLPDSGIIFDKEEGASINLIGKSKGKSAYRSIINPDWDFSKLGIGGLDTEFTAIFRRAFASRVFPPEYIEQLGMKHVRGILLYGPPGTGKTLMARQIGKMLNAREPKIVNGPQILDKYVGESEANVRKLFADAEEEQRRCGANSGLHIIIFDEIDAICKQRGSMAGSSSVHDTVVNQLLSKMDGVEQLNNILVIGMTNRRDMIDEALLRPGRLEVQVEINLPDEAGRLQILKIHTARMRDYGTLDADVDLNILAAQSKNFSGAEIEGLVRAAQSSAMNRLVKPGGKELIDPDAVEKLSVKMADFEHALENDVKPAFGCAEDKLARFLRLGVINWGKEFSEVLEMGALAVAEARESKLTVSCCLSGSAKSGKSALAAQIAKISEFPFVKVISCLDMIGYSESAKCQIVKKAFDDAMRSPLSILFLDDIEELVDYCAIGPRFSNLVLRTVSVLLKQDPPPGHHLLVLATSSEPSFMREFGFNNLFSHKIDVPLLTRSAHVMAVAEDCQLLSITGQESQELPARLDRLFARGGMENGGVQLRGVGIKRLLACLTAASNCAEGRQAVHLVGQLEKLAMGLD
ncbi:nsf-1 [Pristionchus pacificus]|nr:nsf-1 [Pristionchus pacificus]